MKVAIVHDWLTAMRGGERCLEVFCELFPDADILTLVHVRGAVSPTIEKHPIRTSFIQSLPYGVSRYRYYLPLFPSAIRSFDLSGYDLILSSSSCVAKGVLAPPHACHVSYVYTPMRYIWDQYDAYFSAGRSGWLSRSGMGAVRRRLREWDVSSNSSIHSLLTISNFVAGRIKQYWGLDATVVYPPVDWHAFRASTRDDGYDLIVGAFAPYKRMDLAIEAFNRMRKPLKIIGSGQDERRLRRIAGPTVDMLGWQPDHVVREYYERCRALIFPSEEDFGIVPLEAMACGKPVIAYGRGGAVETVVPINQQEAKDKRQEALSSSVAGSNLEPRARSRVPPTGGVLL